ncbi:MAG: GNAT family N-acetyltransferase [Bacteroidetes bacterium]|nr:GNAT family N-acetyltransferase [Bacteroidota bacterium]
MKNNYRIETSTDHYHVIELLEDGLYRYNSEKTGRHDGLNFSRVVKDEENNIIAGISGWTWAGSCEITHLWVSPTFHQHGIGTHLLQSAEAEARKQHCQTILVRTFSFQAPEFYKKHGFSLAHTIDDFPSGHGYHILIKNL